MTTRNTGAPLTTAPSASSVRILVGYRRYKLFVKEDAKNTEIIPQDTDGLCYTVHRFAYTQRGGAGGGMQPISDLQL